MDKQRTSLTSLSSMRTPPCDAHRQWRPPIGGGGLGWGGRGGAEGGGGGSRPIIRRYCAPRLTPSRCSDNVTRPKSSYPIRRPSAVPRPVPTAMQKKPRSARLQGTFFAALRRGLKPSRAAGVPASCACPGSLRLKLTLCSSAGYIYCCLED
jgi:hypothetical protein